MPWYKFITWPNWMILSGGLIAAAGAFFSAITEKQDAAKAEGERQTFQNQLAEKNEKIAELSQSSLNQMKGADGFCDCLVEPGSDDETWTVSIVNGSDLPLHEVTVTIADGTSVIAAAARAGNSMPLYKSRTEIEKALSMKRDQVGTIPACRIAYDVAQLKIPTGRNNSRFNISIESMNGECTYVVQFKKFEDRWDFKVWLAGGPEPN